MAKRPPSIVNFEWAYWLAMILAYANVALTWQQTVAEIETSPGLAGRGTLYMVWYLVFWTPFNLLTWYFAAYRRSVAAKWMIVTISIWNIFDLGGWAIAGQLGEGLARALTLLFFIPSFLAVWFLFRPDAKRWFDERHDLPDVFR
jgi:hypothetical protein